MSRWINGLTGSRGITTGNDVEVITARGWGPGDACSGEKWGIRDLQVLFPGHRFRGYSQVHGHQPVSAACFTCRAAGSWPRGTTPGQKWVAARAGPPSPNLKHPLASWPSSRHHLSVFSPMTRDGSTESSLTHRFSRFPALWFPEHPTDFESQRGLVSASGLVS